MRDEQDLQKMVEIQKSNESPICWFYSYEEDCIYKVDFNTFVNEKFTLGNPDWQHDIKNWVYLCVEEMKLLDFDCDGVWIDEDLFPQIIEELESAISSAQRQIKKSMNLKLYLKGEYK